MQTTKTKRISPPLRIVSVILILAFGLSDVAFSFEDCKNYNLAPELATKPSADEQFHKKWTESYLTFLIGYALKAKISEHTLIPLIEKRGKEKSITEILRANFNIGGITGIKDDNGNTIAFSLPIKEGGVVTHNKIYSLRAGTADAMPDLALTDGINVYVRTEALDAAATGKALEPPIEAPLIEKAETLLKELFIDLLYALRDEIREMNYPDAPAVITSEWLWDNSGKFMENAGIKGEDPLHKIQYFLIRGLRKTTLDRRDGTIDRGKAGDMIKMYGRLLNKELEEAKIVREALLLLRSGTPEQLKSYFDNIASHVPETVTREVDPFWPKKPGEWIVINQRVIEARHYIEKAIFIKERNGHVTPHSAVILSDRTDPEPKIDEKPAITGRRSEPIKTFLYKGLDIKVFGPDEENPKGRLSIRQQRQVIVTLAGGATIKEVRWKDIFYEGWPTALRSQIHTIISEELDYKNVSDYLSEIYYCRKTLKDSSDGLPENIRAEITRKLNDAFAWAKRAAGDNGRKHSAVNLEKALHALSRRETGIAIEEIDAAISNLEKRRTQIWNIKNGEDGRLEPIYIQTRNTDIYESLKQAKDSYASGKIRDAIAAVAELYNTYFKEIANEQGHRQLRKQLAELAEILDRINLHETEPGTTGHLSIPDSFDSAVHGIYETLANKAPNVGPGTFDPDSIIQPPQQYYMTDYVLTRKFVRELYVHIKEMRELFLSAKKMYEDGDVVNAKQLLDKKYAIIREEIRRIQHAMLAGLPEDNSRYTSWQFLFEKTILDDCFFTLSVACQVSVSMSVPSKKPEKVSEAIHILDVISLECAALLYMGEEDMLDKVAGFIENRSLYGGLSKAGIDVPSLDEMFKRIAWEEDALPDQKIPNTIALSIPEFECVQVEKLKDAVKIMHDTKNGKSADERQPLIIAVGTKWMKGYERGESQFEALNPLVTSLRNFCGRNGITLRIEDDEKLPRAIQDERETKDKENARVVVLALQNTIEKEFGSFLDDKNFVLIGVDDTNITENSYIRIVEMIRLGFEIIIDPKTIPDSQDIIVKFDSKKKIFIFLPKPTPKTLTIEDRNAIYYAQRFA